MSLSRKHVWFYLGWLISFAIVELKAVFSKKRGDTLSEMIWTWQRTAKWIFFLVSAFAAWLWYHFTFQVAPS